MLTGPRLLFRGKMSKEQKEYRASFFCTPPAKSLSVVLVASDDTIFPNGARRHVQGLEAKFNRGILHLDGTSKRDFEIMKGLRDHRNFGKTFKFIKTQVPVEVDGKKGSVEGPTLDEIIANCADYWKNNDKSKEVKGEEAPEIRGVMVNSGAVTTATLGEGAPRSKHSVAAR